MPSITSLIGLAENGSVAFAGASAPSVDLSLPGTRARLASLVTGERLASVVSRHGWVGVGAFAAPSPAYHVIGGLLIPDQGGCAEAAFPLPKGARILQAAIRLRGLHFGSLDPIEVALAATMRRLDGFERGIGSLEFPEPVVLTHTNPELTVTTTDPNIVEYLEDDSIVVLSAEATVLANGQQYVTLGEAVVWYSGGTL